MNFIISSDQIQTILNVLSEIPLKHSIKAVDVLRFELKKLNEEQEEIRENDNNNG